MPSSWQPFPSTSMGARPIQPTDHPSATSGTARRQGSSPKTGRGSSMAAARPLDRAAEHRAPVREGCSPRLRTPNRSCCAHWAIDLIPNVAEPAEGRAQPSPSSLVSQLRVQADFLRPPPRSDKHRNPDSPTTLLRLMTLVAPGPATNTAAAGRAGETRHSWRRPGPTDLKAASRDRRTSNESSREVGIRIRRWLRASWRRDDPSTVTESRPCPDHGGLAHALIVPGR